MANVLEGNVNLDIGDRMAILSIARGAMGGPYDAGLLPELRSSECEKLLVGDLPQRDAWRTRLEYLWL